MPRHFEAPDEKDPLGVFALELRSLRDRAGSSASAIDDIAEREGISRSTLYAALGGKRLPSRAVVGALARAWGGNEADLLRSRTEVERKLRRSSSPKALTE